MQQVNFKIQKDRLDMIDSAAELCGVSRTQFLTEASEAAAIEVHTELKSIEIDSSDFESFQKALDAPAQNNENLKALLSRKPIWER